MLKINNYDLTTFKLKTNIKIIFLSDLHYNSLFDKNLEEKIINKIKNIDYDYLFITGDLVDNIKYIDDRLISFLKKICIKKTFIVLGNHDIQDETSVYKWKKVSKDIDNLYLLDNEKYEDVSLNIIGLTLPVSYYKKEDSNIIINELNKKYNLDCKYTILLIHSPKKILTNRVVKKARLLEKIDLILCGHMHDGLVPKRLKKLPLSIGLISPQKRLFPKYAKGKIVKKINNHECTLLISGGVTKLSDTLPKMIKKFRFLYDNEIEYLNIRGKNG